MAVLVHTAQPDSLSEPATVAEQEGQDTGRPARGLAWLARFAPAVLPAVIMLVVGQYHARNPSLGWDENATLIVSQRTLGQIVDLIQHTDGSIAPYYLFMHFWVGLFGTSEIALRAPSIVAMAAGVGLVGELGRRLLTPAAGLLAAVLLTAVPLTSRYAQEARVYGIAFMLVTLATLLLYRAVERPTWRRWCWYGLAVLLVGLAHVIALTVLAGHAFVVGNRWRAQPARRALARWVPVTAAAVVLVSPLLVLGLTQRREQLDWIKPVTSDTIRAAPADLFGAPAVAWLVIGLAILATWTNRGLLAELAVAAVVPPALLIAASQVTSPIWVPRYVLFVLAPTALLAAAAVARFPLRAVVVLGLVAVMAWPAQVALRGPATHHGPDFRRIAGIVSAGLRPGDGIVYGGGSSWSLRAGVDYYLSGKPAPADLLLDRPAAAVGSLSAKECADTAACVGRTRRIWLIRLYQRKDPLAAAGPIAPILRAGYHSVRVWRITKGTVALYERNS
ncbi:MAG: glycosyltransferase family 39 protein [Micromonosporaceae bacterium]|nr:glycosyltransferase family 39 protein [Micromonosporaceae bacterium]